MAIPGWLTVTDLAERLGVQPASIYRYKTRGDLPEPDDTIGKSPIWREDTIIRWMESRPGQGWRAGRKG